VRRPAPRREGDELVIVAEGHAFLRHMVRNLVGTLVEVGRGRLDPVQVQAILDSRDRARAGPTAPACGLCLDHIEYDASHGQGPVARSEPEASEARERHGQGPVARSEPKASEAPERRSG
jgi:tRNA pseudouridine38-40 synthase